MKHVLKRGLAFALAIAMMVALVAVSPVTAFAEEDDYEVELAEDYDAPEVTAAPNYVTVTVTEETNFSFTPNASGYWTFVTSENYDGATPRLWVINHYGHILAQDRGTAPNGNAIVKLHLVEGAPYVIRAGYDWDSSGTYTLTVFMSEEFERPTRPIPEPVVIPGSGGVVRGWDRILYSFTPDTSGLWVIHGEGDGDWFELEIQNAYWNTIAFTMDNWNTEFRATVRLVAGAEYIIRGWSDWEARYTINIYPTDTFEPWIEWDVLAEWGLVMDFDAVREIIPPSGDSISVRGESFFSFTPNSTGPWIFDTENVSDEVFIIITDTYGSFMTPIESYSWWNNFGVVDLEEGIEYIIWASSFWDDDFTFTLIVATPEEWEPDFDDWDDDWDTGTDWGTRIPSEGGQVMLDDDFMFLFAPATTGSWSLQLMGEGMGWREISLQDETGSFWVDDWDTGMISVHLAAEREYIIHTWVSWDIMGAMLHVSPTYEIAIPRPGMQGIRRVSSETDFTFTPTVTGYWVINTFNAVGSTDPYLWLLDAEGNILAQDDDGGEGLNALIKIRLEAGVEYTIRAGFFAGTGEYMLSVAMAGGMQAQRNLVVLEPPAL
ncbi:MAG: hypothetical protein FWE11_10690 [Defluviitaleaceae bacterium]|nr:hypothetical protein [Defluviitaleaceae bacterium]